MSDVHPVAELNDERVRGGPYAPGMTIVMARTVWPDSVQHSWFQAASGRIANLWPASSEPFGRITRHQDLTRDFVLMHVAPVATSWRLVPATGRDAAI